ncbi:MAG: hypothetical protein OEX19_17220 [Gammaproteobacteria bacterium]|nr:hypothetical protein [Gammaproteobacteria bacterium]
MYKRGTVAVNRVKLEQLQYKIEQAFNNHLVKGGTASVTEASYQKDCDEIDGWYREIKTIMNDLESRKQLKMNFDYGKADPELKYGNVSTDEWSTLKKMAKVLKDMLDDIVHRRNVPEGGSLGQHIDHILQEGFKTFKHFTDYEHILNHGQVGKTISKNTIVKVKQSLVVSRNDHVLKGPSTLDPGAGNPMTLFPFIIAMVHLYVAARFRR